MNFRNITIKKQDYVLSVDEKNVEDVEINTLVRNFTKNLFVGMVEHAMLLDSNKYDFIEFPYTFRERQLDTVLLPTLSTLCKGIVMAEYPVNRNQFVDGEKHISKGRIDYWCIYKDYSFVIEVKHSYDNYATESTQDARLLGRWKYMIKNQLKDVTSNVKLYEEKTKGVIRLGLHFIASYENAEPTENGIVEYRNNSKTILERLYADMKKISKPDFMFLWKVGVEQVLYNKVEGRTFPGLILVVKYFKPIIHKGARNIPNE